ncbi:hypothetical protein LTR70_003132 [Exophiala xenobiotica]|uniref:Uncharacterized protein n=1 Tax=Lithohypha guttulata TaxID=1690604 RepID=A0ABR0KH36_9EURO|nr:hypothetical protein LTR24_002636 [Lithohypha guttulata]KAK5323843.1 hypothetical protein LTR70_003132 [Exophiala xenobiotica]
MSPFTPVNPEWKRQKNAASQLHSLQGECSVTIHDVPFAQDEGSPDADTPKSMVEETRTADPYGVDNGAHLWEDFIDLATLYGFSRPEKSKRDRVCRVNKGRESTKKEQKRLERLREKLTRALGDHSHAPDIEVCDRNRPPAAQDSECIAATLIPDVPPADIDAEGHQPPALSITPPLGEPTEDIPNAHTPLIDNVSTSHDAKHYSPTLDATKHMYLAHSALPSPPPSSSESTAPTTPQEHLPSNNPHDHHHGVFHTKPKISHQWIQVDHTVPSDAKAARAASSFTEIPYCRAYRSTTTLHRPPLLNLKFRPISPGISRAYPTKTLPPPPLLSAHLPFSLLPTPHATKSPIDTLPKTKIAKQPQPQPQPHTQAEAELPAQHQYEATATATNNRKLAALPTPTPTTHAHAGTAPSFTRVAVLRAATRLAKMHSQREKAEGRRVSVRFDEEDARRDLAEWRGGDLTN